MTIHQILFLDIETTRHPQTYAEINDHGKAAFKKRFRKEIAELALELYRPEPDKHHPAPWPIPYGEEKAAQQIYHLNAPLFAEYGRIACISIGYIPDVKKTDGVYKIKLKTWQNLDNSEAREAAILQEFAAIVAKFDFLCGHMIKEFDFPWLMRKMMVHEIRLPRLFNTFGKKPWDLSIIDTADMWKSSSYKYYASLDQVAYALGVASSKDGIVGIEVPQAYYDGLFTEIAKYCEKDVVTLIRIFLRMYAVIPLAEGETPVPLRIADQDVYYTNFENESIGTAVPASAQNAA